MAGLVKSLAFTLLLSAPSYAATNCCDKLKASLGSQVLFGQDEFTMIESYWAAQAEEMKPACVVQPKTAEDVSFAVKTLAEGFKEGCQGCQFAVRSGGHTPGANQNNINDGVTIDLSYINQVTPKTEQGIISVGPGNRWEDVYGVLDPLNLTVVGGRSRTVGVGGLVLSAGMSFFSARYGLACDNVVNYQIILADGQIVDANETSRPDLYKALKGGVNNFGVVTRLDLRAVNQGEFWGGVATYPDSSLEPLINLTYKFAQSEGYDQYSQLTMDWGFYKNNSILMTNNHYTKGEAPPSSVFGDFVPLQSSNTWRMDSMTGFAKELASTNDNGTIRKAFATATYKNDLYIAQRIANLSQSTMDDLKGTVDQFIVSVQPFGPFIMKHSAATGGNSLGLDAEEKDRTLYCLTVAWENEADDEKVYGAMKDLIDKADLEAEQHDASDDYIFLNYAGPWQDAIAGYGRSNIANMKAVSQKYDPDQIFQKAVPGGVKLSA